MLEKFRIALFGATLFGICHAGVAIADLQPKSGGRMHLTSNAIIQGQPIPRKCTCDGSDTSPALAWANAPQATQSFALITDDPDAPGGTWVHWVIWNIPPTAHALPEGMPASAKLADGSQQGKNSWPKIGYGGPCPPSGTHRYFFKLYALDKLLDLPPGATKEQLLAAMNKHVLGQAELMGTYQR